ncbi:MBL fold metallo-hydrolase [Ahrensia sp. R2A130]|uniref:MBL fold metallo-hydrolase n=1 Tax=Ahrensia sp. R2A130 TaxID=744979 RepID=UPI0001E0BCEB|nr:MBL fold metallo-hydrolase [Ahrensia sp. R2A130]EFL87586.1 glyoxylase B2 [Ahrensia sp. R2A130]
MAGFDNLTKYSPSTGSGSPNVWGVYEAATGSIQYIVACPDTKKAVVIDAVLNFDTKSASTTTRSAEYLLGLIDQNGLTLERILDTHPHADHVMASHWLKQKTGCPNAIGAKTRNIAAMWRDFYNLPNGLNCDDCFDAMFEHGDTFEVGNLTFSVILSAGHTMASISYLVGDAGFIHDTLMVPDCGSSRADFPGGSTEDLWNSIQAILALPDDTRLFIGHDYGKGERTEPMWEATVAEHKAHNAHVGNGTPKADFIRTREERDATLALPDRMLHALQMNLCAGALPEAEADGQSYLKIPLNRF